MGNVVVNPSIQKSPRFIEIVGVAGTGKTTIVNALENSGNDIIVSYNFLSCNHLIYLGLGFFEALWFFISREPTLLDYFLTDSFYSASIRALFRFCERNYLNDSNVRIFDQGPIYLIASRRWRFVEKYGKEQGFDKWWYYNVKDYVKLLDAVVWLDASDEFLIERIESRSKGHQILQVELIEKHRTLRKHRESYKYVFDLLIACGCKNTLTVNVETFSLKQVIEIIKQRLLL